MFLNLTQIQKTFMKYGKTTKFITDRTQTICKDETIDDPETRKLTFEKISEPLKIKTFANIKNKAAKPIKIKKPKYDNAKISTKSYILLKPTNT